MNRKILICLSVLLSLLVVVLVFGHPVLRPFIKWLIMQKALHTEYVASVVQPECPMVSISQVNVSARWLNFTIVFHNLSVPQITVEAIIFKGYRRDWGMSFREGEKLKLCYSGPFTEEIVPISLETKEAGEISFQIIIKAKQ